MSIDWTRIVKKYKGQWVALKDDQKSVIAAAPTLKLAIEKAKKKGYQRPIMTRMPNPLMDLRFLGLHVV